LEADTFLARHLSGVPKWLDISFPSVTRHRVVAQLEIHPEHLGPGGGVHGSVVMALAECANTYGAILNLTAGRRTTTLEAKTNYLTAGAGNTLRAEASPLHVGQAVSVWRSAVFRDGQAVADVTQTQLTVEDDAAGAGRVEAKPDRERRSSAHGLVSGSFSTEVIDERWRQILEGASRVIGAKGFAKATIREIAAAAEMPVPTMYQYLERKEDILYNLYRFFMTDIVSALERWRSSEMPPRERLVGAIRTMVDVFDKNHRFIKLMFQETRALTPEARLQVYALDAQYISIFRDLLAEAMRAGEFRIRNVELAANFVYFLCTIWPLRFWSIGKYGEEAVTNEIVDFVLSGLGAMPATDSAKEQCP
jgi:uncharacterized protein (TIGR00369 family)